MEIYIFIMAFIIMLHMLQQSKVYIEITKLGSLDEKKFVSIMIAFILFAVLGFRYNVGADYMNYYYYITHDSGFVYAIKGEILSAILMNISSYFNSPVSYFAINAFIVIYLMMISINNYSKDTIISWLIFISFFYITSFSVVRFFTALSIVFYSMKYLVEDKYVKYVICIAIATLFHITAIYAFVFLLLKTVKMNVKKYLMLIGCFFALKYMILFFVQFFLTQYVYYLGSESESGRFMILPSLIIAIILLMFYKNINKDKIIDVCIKNFFVGFSTYLIFYNNISTVGPRLSLYGTIFMIIIIPYIIGAFEFKSRIYIKFIYWIICICMYGLMLYISASSITPYQTVFS